MCLVVFEFLSVCRSVCVYGCPVRGFCLLSGAYHADKLLINLVTSHVSGRGNIFGSVRVCVRPCVCFHSAGRTVGPTDLKFGTRIKDHHISDKFEG